ncbi:unnamed protein product, partial [Tetraodon nigroviridis]
KVSKPLMEKKRRARINKCLDQLKSLLESYYSSSVSIRQSINVTFNVGISFNQFLIIYFPLSDPKAQAGESGHSGAHGEPPQTPAEDSEL